MMSDARQVEDKMTAAVEHLDMDEVMACYSDDAVLVAPEGTYKGKDQIKNYFAGWLESFSNVKFDYFSKFDSGDKAADEGTFNGTNTGDITMPDGSTVPATGKQVSLHSVDVAEVHDGKITEHHFYYDQAELTQQLGLAPA